MSGSTCRIDHFYPSAFLKELILTLLITIIAEGAVVIGYSIGHKKPVRPILFTSICVNLITQFFLWVVLNLFFQDYLITLLIAEVFIWMLESVLLYRFPPNQLRLQEAILLSLSMNLVSFALGWFLPI
jgi:hypothetical protein